jgi:muramoyltetrapeptide carboxypeptidase LdcA involved in peptidoglycan recycling
MVATNTIHIIPSSFLVADKKYQETTEQGLKKAGFMMVLEQCDRARV